MRIAYDRGPAADLTVSRFRSLFSCDRLGAPVSQEILDDLALAVAEIGANAIRHAARLPSEMQIDVYAEGPCLRVEMRDDGPPFPEFERLWEAARFAPMDPMAESGRGLWLVRNSVDRLEYDATDGNRWTFVRNFARDEKAAILLVEDDAATRSLFVSVLSKIAQVSIAGSLAEAREAMRDTQFDLVISDFNLEDGNSAEWLDSEAGEGGAADIPFIFVTGDRSGLARSSALRHGVHTVMEKPVRPRELLARAAEAIAAHRAHSVRASLRLAKEVEQRIALDRCTQVGKFRVVARGASASVGGGDLFADLGEAGPRRRFALADCAGHGVPARLQSALLSGLMAGLSHRAPTTDSFLESVSAAILRGGALESLVATVLAVDFEGEQVELATAGHPAPLLLRADGTASPVYLEGALPGLLPHCGARPVTLRLGEGERLLLATDGVAPDSGATLAGMPAAVERQIAELRHLPIAEAAEALQAAIVEEFGAYPADDWTFVLIEAAQPARR